MIRSRKKLKEAAICRVGMLQYNVLTMTTVFSGNKDITAFLSSVQILRMGCSTFFYAVIASVPYFAFRCWCTQHEAAWNHCLWGEILWVYPNAEPLKESQQNDHYGIFAQNIWVDYTLISKWTLITESMQSLKPTNTDVNSCGTK